MITSHYRQLVQLLCLVCVLGAQNACVGELYRSIKADLDFELEPQVHERLKTNPEVVAIHYALRLYYRSKEVCRAMICSA